MCQDLPGYENYTNHQLQELSYSSDRNYFCQPYIGFVPESQEFKNVRKEMVRYSNKSAKVSTSITIEYISFPVFDYNYDFQCNMSTSSSQLTVKVRPSITASGSQGATP